AFSVAAVAAASEQLTHCSLLFFADLGHLFLLIVGDLQLFGHVAVGQSGSAGLLNVDLGQPFELFRPENLGQFFPLLLGASRGFFAEPGAVLVRNLRTTWLGLDEKAIRAVDASVGIV